MVLNFLDAGTTWSKILTVHKNGEKEYKIIPSASLKENNINFTSATGHCAKISKTVYENEVVALAKGAQKQLLRGDIVLDLGSRDIKWIKYKDGKFQDMDWNTSCASATGATIEMLLKFYNVNPDELKPSSEKYAVTCGIFGLEKIMDDVAGGTNADIAISKFIKGIAYNAWNFTKNPDKLCISGGFCENKCFIESLKEYCEVETLGRYVLVDGLYTLHN